MSFKEEDEDLYSDNNEDRHMLGEKMKNIREADLTSQRALYSAKISEFDPNKQSWVEGYQVSSQSLFPAMRQGSLDCSAFDRLCLPAGYYTHK